MAENITKDNKHNYTKDFIDLLTNISNITFKRGDVVRASSFKKAANSLTLYHFPIYDIEEVTTLIKNKKLKYVGNSTYKILKEHILSIEENRESVSSIGNDE